MDEIKLPCGLVLTPGVVWANNWPGDDGPTWTAELCGGSLQLMIAGYVDGSGFDAMCGDRWSEKIATLAGAISWLNSRVEELVASLGAVIVPGDARRKVFAELRRFDATSTDGHLMSQTDAVLASLGMVKP